MKILRIGILNLNSLRGEQTIDFTASPLTDHQLYAITGPTGAGKTTILDAITLALYGQTERNKSEKDRKDGSGSVMTYGTGECRAELEYATATGKYRNVWHRQRAHKKPDRDLTASRREINKWNPKTEEWDLLATKKREVDAKTEEVVGLDYDRFVRSVMLTQGDFARFLKSDPGDKAAILEKITGTEVYKDLSMAAYARAKLAREAWERATEALTVAPPMEVEVRESLEQQLAAKQQENETITANLVQLLRKLEGYAQVDALTKRQTEAERESAQLTQRWEALRAERERLALNDQLEPKRAELVRLQKLIRRKEEVEQQQAKIGTQVAALTEQLDALKAATKLVRDKRQDFDQKLPAREEKFSLASKLETTLAELKRDRLGAQTAADKAAAATAQLMEQIKACDKTIQEVTQQLGGKDGPAVEAELKQTEDLVAEREQTMRLAEKQVAAARLREQLEKEQVLATALAKELQAAQATAAAATANYTAAQKALDEAIILFNGLRVSASLHEHKADLQPGEECPICGATEHPALKTYVAVEASRVKAAEEKVGRLQAELATAVALQQQEQDKQQELGRRLAEINARSATIQDQLENIGVVLKKETQLVGLLQYREALEQQLKVDRLAYQNLQELRQKLPQLNIATTRKESLLERQTELAGELRQKKEELTGLAKEVAAKQAEKEALIGKHSVEECRKMVQDKDDKLRHDLAAAEAAERKQSAELAAAAERQKVLRETLDTLVEEEASITTGMKATLLRLKLTIAEAQTALIPVDEVTPLREKLGKLEQMLKTAAMMRKDIELQLATAQTAIAALPEYAQLQQEKEALDHTARTVNQLIGALNLQLKQDDERIAEVAAKKEAISGLRKEMDRWQGLNDLIGSADGKKFRSYAQAITLQQLIAIGNDHLLKINPRYRMEYEAPGPGAPERLEMIIIDQYQNDNRRTMATLSGGESFLISLALALGLSDLASGKRLIQSLFIDEGFGTLDGKTLDQAMTTLEQLQAQGKTIGLISHVPQLQERIQCQLVLKRVGDGFSRVEVRG